MESIEKLLFDKSYINGEWQESPKSFEVLNPYNNKLIVKVHDSTEQQWEDAVNSASDVFDEWKSKTAKDRATILDTWFNLIIQHKEELSQIMCLESGKPYTECLGEIAYGASFIQWFAEEAKRLYGDTIPGFTSDRRVQVIRQPIGVVACITPWNFPMAMITRKVAPALAAGCTAVIRPSAETPLSALALNFLADQAGMPKGVMNTIVGNQASAMGKFLCEHPKVAKISFTGSTQVGQLLAAQSASTLKKVSLELGGNAPFIVFKDADIEKAVKGAIAAKYRFAGQTCVCVNRILVHEDVYPAFTKRFTEETKKLKIDDPINPKTNIGPLINQKAIDKIKRFVEDALKKGGEILCGGDTINETTFAPTVISNANSKMLFAKEEIFGPLAPIFSFKNFEEAIKMANDTIYGLASYIYTNDINTSILASEQLEYGMVGINEGIISSEVVPFGGVKYSGYGREGSKYGIEDYTIIKYICIGNVK